MSRILRIIAEGGVNHLDSGVTIQARINGPIDARHAAVPQHFFQTILVKLFTEQAVLCHGK
jgi:hypothetical protein